MGGRARGCLLLNLSLATPLGQGHTHGVFWGVETSPKISNHFCVLRPISPLISETLRDRLYLYSLLRFVTVGDQSFVVAGPRLWITVSEDIIMLPPPRRGH